jgi:hypothetical protein
MRELAIDRAEVWVVGPETERCAWALEMPEQFMSNTILRLTAKGGLEGVAGAAMWSTQCVKVPKNKESPVVSTTSAASPSLIVPYSVG